MDITFKVQDFRWDMTKNGPNTGWLNCDATVLVYWGDSGSSCDSFSVRHTMYYEGDTLIVPSDAQDFDLFNHDLEVGLGVLEKAFRKDIEESLYEHFWREWEAFLAKKDTVNTKA
jgi:hypothetical protein